MKSDPLLIVGDVRRFTQHNAGIHIFHTGRFQASIFHQDHAFTPTCK